jgi:D-aminopeptidase
MQLPGESGRRFRHPEEAIVNAMVAAQTMTGGDGLRVYALPHDRLRAALRKYNRLSEPPAR